MKYFLAPLAFAAGLGIALSAMAGARTPLQDAYLICRTKCDGDRCTMLPPGQYTAQGCDKVEQQWSAAQSPQPAAAPVLTDEARSACAQQAVANFLENSDLSQQSGTGCVWRGQPQ